MLQNISRHTPVIALYPTGPDAVPISDEQESKCLGRVRSRPSTLHQPKMAGVITVEHFCLILNLWSGMMSNITDNATASFVEECLIDRWTRDGCMMMTMDEEEVLTTNRVLRRCM